MSDSFKSQSSSLQKCGIIGAIAGDIVGSVYEFDNIKSVDFKLFTPYNIFTDDTVMTIAVADWLLSGEDIAVVLRRWGHK